MPEPLPTSDEIRDWLDRINRDRFWYAEQVGATKGTVDSWFSTRGFPKWALLHTAKLMREASPAGELGKLNFTTTEFDSIEKARHRAGYLSRKEFYRDAILEKVRAILSPYLHQSPQPTSRVAEDPDDQIRQQLDDDRTAN